MDKVKYEELISKLEDIWDYHHETIGDSIYDAQYWSGEDVMTKSEFKKAIIELLEVL